MKMFQGNVTHDVVVTRIPGKGYGVRVYVDGTLNQQTIVRDRADVGAAARSMLRMECKMGNDSDYAERARYREWEKAERRKAATPTTLDGDLGELLSSI